MKKFSELDPTVRTNLISHIDQRWRQLYELEKEWGERALKYLLLTNSGGAIATLSFLGTSDHSRNLLSLKLALVCFSCGVFLVGISTAIIFHKMAYLLKEYKRGTNDFFIDKITWEYLTEEDEKRSKPCWWNYAVPYSSFGCFLLGIVIGAVALFA